MHKLIRLLKRLSLRVLRNPIDTCVLCAKAGVLMIRRPSRFREIGKNINRIVVLGEEDHPLIKETIHIEHSDPYLVITTQYPIDGDEYRNMFIHRRVNLYKKNNFIADVFCFRHGDYLTEYE